MVENNVEVICELVRAIDIYREFDSIKLKISIITQHLKRPLIKVDDCHSGDINTIKLICDSFDLKRPKIKSDTDFYNRSAIEVRLDHRRGGGSDNCGGNIIIHTEPYEIHIELNKGNHNLITTAHPITKSGNKCPSYVNYKTHIEGRPFFNPFDHLKWKEVGHFAIDTNLWTSIIFGKWMECDEIIEKLKPIFK